MRKILLFYPPGKTFQRGEERCQANISASTCVTPRAANDLGYVAAVLGTKFEVLVRDFSGEDENVFWQELQDFAPDIIFTSTTNISLLADLQLIALIRQKYPNVIVIINGAVFFDPPSNFLQMVELNCADYLIGGESEFVIEELLTYHDTAPEKISTLQGVIYKQDAQWIKTTFNSWTEDITLPFPDRHKMDNARYVCPYFGVPQATITVARGCSNNCIFCQTPIMSGRKVRRRTVENVLAELVECFTVHKISNFFFKADTFTADEAWVSDLCDAINESTLAGKIRWCANSRAAPLSAEVLRKMKRAGCWLMSVGFESGHSESLVKMQKGTTLADNLTAAKMIKASGIKLYGFFMIGFPWETKAHLTATYKHMVAVDADFVELHLATPFVGTPLYKMVHEKGFLGAGANPVADYFSSATKTCELSASEVEAFQQRALLCYHLRSTYLLRKLWEVVTCPRRGFTYLRFAYRLLQNIFSR